MKHVEVGMFRLPGLTFGKEEITPEVLEEMQAWAEAEGVGMNMTETLWSFKKEAHRDWFVLRWSDSLVKPKAEDV
jgi:L-rhamnose isomerase